MLKPPKSMVLAALVVTGCPGEPDADERRLPGKVELAAPAPEPAPVPEPEVAPEPDAVPEKPVDEPVGKIAPPDHRNGMPGKVGRTAAPVEPAPGGVAPPKTPPR